MREQPEGIGKYPEGSKGRGQGNNILPNGHAFVMFAIVSDGARQHRIEADTLVSVDYVDAPAGSPFVFKSVLFASEDGNVFDGSSVSVKAVVFKHSRDDKVMILKRQRRCSGFAKVRGHKQMKTMVFIESIDLNK